MRDRRPPMIVFSAGHRVSTRLWRVWQVLQLIPVVLLLFAVLAGLSASAPVLNPGILFGLVVLVALVGYSAWLRRWSYALVRLAHTAPSERGLHVTRQFLEGRGSLPLAVGWASLVLLWAGEAEEAETALRSAMRRAPQLAELRLWWLAARGELDVEHRLSLEEPQTMGGSYRLTVALALGALAAPASRETLLAVMHRVHSFEHTHGTLPNRYGELLTHLAARVEARLQGASAPYVPPALEWLDRAWPHLASRS